MATDDCINKQEDPNELTESLRELLQSYAEIKDRIYRQYDELVQMVVDYEITGYHEIEHIMDGLLDFVDDIPFIELYKKLCRHAYCQYPKLVGEYVALFRMQYEESNDTDHNAE